MTCHCDRCDEPAPRCEHGVNLEIRDCPQCARHCPQCDQRLEDGDTPDGCRDPDCPEHAPSVSASTHGADDGVMTAAEMGTYIELYAVPGERHTIDMINPVTDLTLYGGETEAQVKARYPDAVRMTWAAWQAEASARQQTPITWDPSTAEQYDEMLNCLPPIAWRNGAFLVGEASDHCVTTGRPRYQAYRRVGAEYFASSRPITVAEGIALQT